MADMPSDLLFDAPTAETLAVDADFWSLYKSAFPSNEREPPSVILDTVRDGAGFVQRARLRDITVGMAFMHLLQEPTAGFLVYVAVTKKHRSRHIGAALFERTWASTQLRFAAVGRAPLGLIWEVDAPEDAENPEELERRRRRIAFFERRGARLLPTRYLQPPVDGISPVPMRLMFFPAANMSPPDEAVTAALIRAVYFEKYVQRNRIPRDEIEELLRRVS